MKVSDILREDNRVPGSARAHQGMLNTVGNRQQISNAQHLGTGYSAYVDRIDDPHEMDNVNRFASAADATAKLHAWLKENGVNNPFLPRVLSVNTDDNGVTHSKIEQLVPFTSPKVLSDELALSWTERLFKEPTANQLKEMLTSTTRKDPLGWWVNAFAKEIDRALESRSNNVKDEQLLAAIEILQTWKATTPKVFADVHDENIMWRIGPGGPQLVITDPYANM